MTKKRALRTVDPSKWSATVKALNPQLCGHKEPAPVPVKVPKKPQKQPKAHVPSVLEKRFMELWNGPELVAEYRFHPGRRWRADFAHMGTKTLIEIEGGMWGNGRHNRAMGAIADAEKYLEAALGGWRVIRLTSPQLTMETLARVANAIRGWMVKNQ